MERDRGRRDLFYALCGAGGKQRMQEGLVTGAVGTAGSYQGSMRRSWSSSSQEESSNSKNKLQTSSKIQNPIRIVRLHPQSRIEAWSLKII
ncbi:MAG: hypothetical protein ACJASX_000913 [Limisphaerales bacterium]|jgi:hypothetical protein